MSRMTWEQKLSAMQAVGEPKVHMMAPGAWLCRLPTDIKDRAILSSELGTGKTPEEAVDAAWAIIEALPDSKALVVERFGMPRRYVRWNGFMWADVPAEEIEGKR